MHKTFTQRLTITRLGKRDEIVKEHGKNTDDGWNWTLTPVQGRVPAPVRKNRK